MDLRTRNRVPATVDKTLRMPKVRRLYPICQSVYDAAETPNVFLCAEETIRRTLLILPSGRTPLPFTFCTHESVFEIPEYQMRHAIAGFVLLDEYARRFDLSMYHCLPMFRKAFDIFLFIMVSTVVIKVCGVVLVSI